MDCNLSFGFARMRVEAGERRDLLPESIARLAKMGVKVMLEHTYGSGMGYSHEDYQHAANTLVFGSYEEAFQQDYVFVLRCPSIEDLKLLRPGSCLISMLHYPTRPERTEFIHSLGVEAISLDSIKDDIGKRLVENLRSVAWNGLEVAFRTLRTIYPSPGFDSPHRKCIHVTILGSGAVGVHAVQAAIRYGSIPLWHEMYQRRTPGVQVSVVDFDTTYLKETMRAILSQTDILVDASQRVDASLPIIPNDWIAVMPKHAVLLDLSVDPYNCNEDREHSLRSVKGIEGIPQGNLDQFVFAPDDPAYKNIPDCISTKHRRYAVSCYSWPGVHPRECMLVYGKQLGPIFRALVDRGGIAKINSRGHFFERAISRAMLSHWKDGIANNLNQGDERKQ